MDKRVTNPGRRLLLRPVHKPVMLMQHIFSKFTKPGAMVIDPCMETGATARVCLTDPLHCKTTGSDSDGTCIKKMMLSLLESFEWQILNEVSGIVENGDVENATWPYLEHCKIEWCGLTTMAWKTSEDLPAMQSFPAYVTQFKP